MQSLPLALSVTRQYAAPSCLKTCIGSVPTPQQLAEACRLLLLLPEFCLALQVASLDRPNLPLSEYPNIAYSEGKYGSLITSANCSNTHIRNASSVYMIVSWYFAIRPMQRFDPASPQMPQVPTRNLLSSYLVGVSPIAASTLAFRAILSALLCS